MCRDRRSIISPGEEIICVPGLRGQGGRGWPPGVAGEQAAQDGEDVLAVLAGGVDVAADVQPVLGGVFAGQAAGYLLLGLAGPDAALADVVRAYRRLHAVRAVRRLRAGCV